MICYRVDIVIESSDVAFENYDPGENLELLALSTSPAWRT